MKTGKLRSQVGAMMGIVIASTLVFVILVIGIIQITMLFGGSREVANAVDAGALNTGKQAPTITIDVGGGDEGQFDDVSDDSKFNLKNINRMWAKCLLCLMNEKAMQEEGYSTGQSSGNANKLYTAAQSLSDKLTSKLNTQSNLHPFFNALAVTESVRMLGNSAKISAEQGNGWKTSLMDRGVESNIAVYGEQLPGSFNLNNSKTKSASDNKNYFTGYDPIDILNHKVCFVPFKLKEQPHLVSGKTFESNTATANPISGVQTPVPNAFSCQGSTQMQTQGSQRAKSFVMTNPQKTYDLRIPHGFIKIKLEDNTAHWYLNGIPQPDSDYAYFPPSVQYAGPVWAGAGTLQAMANLGLEFVPPTIWQALTSLPGGDYDELKQVMLQRCRELKHDFSQSQMEDLLDAMLVPGVKDYYIYSNDEGTELKVSPTLSNPVPPSWLLTGSDPDGSEKEICSNDTFWYPNWTMPILSGLGPKPLPSFCHCEDSVNWTPGTGYDGCLGKVRVKHETTVYCNGVCSVF